MTRILIAAVLAAAVGAPSAAHAATIHQDGPTPQRVLLQNDTGDTNLVTVEGTRSIVIHDDNAPITVESPATCMPLDPHSAYARAARERHRASWREGDRTSTSTWSPRRCSAPLLERCARARDRRSCGGGRMSGGGGRPAGPCPERRPETSRSLILTSTR